MFRSRWRRWTLRWLWNMVRPWLFVFVSLMEKSCVSFLGISWNCYTFVDANWSKSLHSYCGCAVCYSSGSQESHLQIYGAKTTERGRCQAHQLVRHEKSIGWDFAYAFFPNLLSLSRKYVWRTFHLVFNGEKLEDDKRKLKEWVQIICCFCRNLLTCIYLVHSIAVLWIMICFDCVSSVLSYGIRNRDEVTFLKKLRRKLTN